VNRAVMDGGTGFDWHIHFEFLIRLDHTFGKCPSPGGKNRRFLILDGSGWGGAICD
jgi:hypothetical protein